MLVTDFEKTKDTEYYVIFDADRNLEDSYELKMITGNHIDNFLNVTSVVIDNVRKYYYDISSVQSIKTVFDKKSITEGDIKNFIISLRNAQNNLSDYLIDYNKILLNPQSVFIDGDQYYFCIYPDNTTDYDVMLRETLEYFLERIDYNDNDLVVFAYQIYHKIVRDKLPVSEITPEVGNRFEKKVVKEDASAAPIQVDSEVDNIYVDKAKEIPFRKYSVTIILAFITMVELIMLFYPQLIPVDVDKRIIYIMIMCTVAGMVLSIKYSIEQNKDKMFEKNTINVSDNEGATMLLGNMIPCLIYSVNHEEQRCNIINSPFIIGSDKNKTDCYIKNRSVSRLHCRIFNEESRYFIEDMDSTNGTKVNGRRLITHEVVEIKNEDIIMVSDVEMVFRY